MQISLFKASIPVRRHTNQKNSRDLRFHTTPTGLRAYTATNRENRSDLDFLVLSLRQRAIELRLDKPIDHPVYGVFKLFFPWSIFYTQDGRISRRLIDLSNALQGPEDALQKAGIIENDSLICSYDGSRRLPADEYRLEIELFKFDEYELIKRPTTVDVYKPATRRSRIG